MNFIIMFKCKITIAIPMEYVNLGKTGLKISRIGLGAWQFGGDAWGPYEYGIARRLLVRLWSLV